MKLKAIILGMFLSLVLVLTACGSNDSSDMLTVSFDSNGGSTIESVNVKSGDKVAKPTDPTKDGYSFDVWTLENRQYDFETPVVEDITLKATWRSGGNTQYTVTFDSDGGSFVSSVKVNSGEKLSTITNPTKSGYTFLYWMANGAEFDLNTPITGNLVLTAKWESTNTGPVEIFTVTFDSNGGNEIASQEVEAGSNAKEPDYPTREGYIFDGWSLNNNFYDFYKNTVNSNITLVALWTKMTAEGQIPMSRFGTNSMIYSALNDLHITGIGGPTGQLEVLYGAFDVDNSTQLAERMSVRFSLYLASENNPENAIVEFDVDFPAGVSTEVTSMPVGVANSIVTEYLVLASMKNPNVVNTEDYKYAIQYVDKTGELETSNHSNFSTTTRFNFTPLTGDENTIPMGGFNSDELVFENNGNLIIKNLNANAPYLKYFFDVDTITQLNDKMAIEVSFYLASENNTSNALFTQEYAMPNGNELIINNLQLVLLFEAAAELNDKITADASYKVNVRYVSKEASINHSNYCDFSNEASIEFGSGDVEIPEGDLTLDVYHSEMYNGNFGKVFVRVNLMNAENHGNFNISVESNEFGGLSLFENFYAGDHLVLTLFLNSNYTEGETYNFKLIVKIGPKVETQDFEITAPGGSTGGGGDVVVPDGDLVVSLNSPEFYNGNHLKLHLSNSLATPENAQDFEYTITCEQFPNLNVIEKFNGGFGMFLGANYGQGVQYTFVVTISIGDKTVTETFNVTSPGTPIDPNADIQLPNIVGFVTYGLPSNGFVVDFDWRGVYSTLESAMTANDIALSVIYEYKLIDTDNNTVIAIVNKVVTNDYNTLLLTTNETKVILLNYLEENNLEEVNFSVELTVKASENPSVSNVITNGEKVTSNNIGFTKPQIYNTAFTYNEFLLESTGEGPLQQGYMSAWWHKSEGAETGLITPSINNGVVNLIGEQPTTGAFWQTQFFAKFNSVENDGTYMQSLVFTSDVAGTIRINTVEYDLVVGENVINFSYELTAGQSVSLSIQFGSLGGGEKTIGDFNISISGFTKAE